MVDVVMVFVATRAHTISFPVDATLKQSATGPESSVLFELKSMKTASNIQNVTVVVAASLEFARSNVICCRSLLRFVG